MLEGWPKNCHVWLPPNLLRMNFEICRTIGADHPSLPGHFPGEPIVPGVVILDEILAVLNECRAGARLTGIPVVKFLAPLKPDQKFTIRLSATEPAAEEIAFSCTSAGRVITEGQLQIARR
jgi:3-hydroxyacyl-[acyl-carrier-protein] dehydratase